MHIMFTVNDETEPEILQRDVTVGQGSGFLVFFKCLQDPFVQAASLPVFT